MPKLPVFFGTRPGSSKMPGVEETLSNHRSPMLRQSRLADLKSASGGGFAAAFLQAVMEAAQSASQVRFALSPISGALGLGVDRGII